MAVASAWAKPGSWALAAEEQDDLPPPPPPVPASDFPDLATAATTKVPKKKKPQAVSLASFNNGTAKFVAPSTRAPAPDVLLSLPTGPRERTEDELVSARWGRESSNDRQPRRGSGMDEFGGGPSRADGSDDWASDRRPMERRDRMGFGGDSRADDVDDWVSTKRAAAPAALPERRERSVAFGSDSLGRADEVDSWVSKKSYAAPSAPPSDGRRGSSGSVWGFNRDGGQEADSWARRREELGSGGGGSSAARPRLNLQKRTLPITPVPVTDENKEAEKEEEEKKEEFQPKPRTSNPFGAARPREEVLAAKGETVAKEEEKKEEEEEEKPVIQRKVRFANPFGAARPREEVLAAKGEDWRKLDEKLDAMKVREAPPERRSFGRRGSPDAGEENGNGQAPESRAESAWRKPDAVEPTTESEPAVEPTLEAEQGSDN